MSTVINTNLASLFAQNSLTNAQNNLATSVQRLSSGLRINSAKDDAAGLAIAQNMQSQINGTNQSIQNLNDATNLLQTADSSLSTIQDMLLRLKQLSTQGYDGSLSITQKLDIVQQMKDLNSEINATASRTSFNGINLLTSGSSIDNVNSDLKSGTVLSNTKIGVDSTVGLGSVGGVLADTAYTAVGGNGTATTFTIDLDPNKQNSTPGTYTFQAVGANLTMTGTWNGVAQSQTVVIGNAAGNNPGGAINPVDQTLDFSNFGIKINLKSNIGPGATETGAQLASSIVGASNQLKVNGQVGVVDNLQLNGVAPGTYQLSYDRVGQISSLSLPASIASGITTNGVPGHLDNVALTGGSGATAHATVNWDSTGNITGFTNLTSSSDFKAGDVLSVAAQGTATTNTVAFSALAAGDTVSVGGLIFTAGSSDVSAADLANAFKSLSAGATKQNGQTDNRVFNVGGGIQIGTFSGALSGWGTAANVSGGGNQLVLTSAAVGPQSNVAISGATITSVSTPTTVSTTTAGVDKIYTGAVDAAGLTAGQTLIVNGTLTITAETAMSATEVAKSIRAASSYTSSSNQASAAYAVGVTTGHIDGYLSGWTLGGANANLTFTANGTNVGNATIPAFTGTGAPTAMATGLTATANTGITAVQSATIGNLASGDSMSLAGRTFTANQAVSATTLATILVSGNATVGGISYGTVGGSLSGWTLASGGAGIVTLTSTNAGPQATASYSSGAHQVASTAPSVASSTAGTLTMGALSGIAVKSLSGATGDKTLTITGSINGSPVKQSVTLTDNPANSVETVNFDTFGVKFDINSYQTQSADDLGFAIANLNGGNSSGTYSTSGTGKPGQLIVATGNNSNLQFQSGANSSAFISINTLNVQTGTTGVNAGTASEMMTVGTDITGIGANGIVVGSLGSLGANDGIAAWQGAFQATAAAVDKAIDYVSTQRSTYGSQMNRLSYINSNLTAQSTNLQNSRSAITDTNFASETATLTKGQIMQQAATAMLAQANQMPNVILSLLK